MLTRFSSRTYRLAARRQNGCSLFALWLGGLALAAAAAVAIPGTAKAAPGELDALIFSHTPANAAVEGWVEVGLDNAGNWSQIETTEVPWRFTMQAVWDEPPQFFSYIYIQIKPASLPEPPAQDNCDGDLCQAISGSSAGFVAQDVVPHLIGAAQMATVNAPLSEIDVAPGIFQDVTGVCHTARQNQLNAGTPLHDLLADGFVTDGTAMIATLVVGPGGAMQIPIPFKVRCKGDPAVADLVAPETNYQGAYTAGYQLSQAAFNITPGYLAGACPLQVTGQAIVEGNGAGVFRYRLEFDSGKASEWANSTLQAKAGGGYAKVLQIPIPLPLPAAAGSGGGIVNQQPGGGLAIQQGPVEPINPGGGPTTPGEVAGIQEPDNVHKGAARLVVSKPDGSNQVVSKFDSYHVVCEDQVTVAIATPKALQMQPKPPQPGTAGAAAALGGNATPRSQAQVPAGLTSGLKADIMGTTLGFLLGGNNPWGSTIVIDKPQLAAATGVGPQQNLCRFEQAGYRPFNKGDVPTGPFNIRVYRGAATVDQSMHNLGAGQTDGWRTFALELPSGLSIIRVVMDADKQVAESDENNTFSVRVNVKLDCRGGPKRVAPGQNQPAPLQRIMPAQPRLPQRQ